MFVVDYATLNDIIAQNGVAIQSVRAMEECAELQKAISKLIRKGNSEKRISNLEEEIADVYLALSQLILMYPVNQDIITSWIDIKTQRELDKLYNKGD